MPPSSLIEFFIALVILSALDELWAFFGFTKPLSTWSAPATRRA